MTEWTMLKGLASARRQDVVCIQQARCYGLELVRPAFRPGTWFELGGRQVSGWLVDTDGRSWA
jgi:hypothetical protein